MAQDERSAETPPAHKRSSAVMAPPASSVEGTDVAEQATRALTPNKRSRRRTVKEWVMTGLMVAVAFVFMIPFYWLVITTLRPADRIFADAGRFIPTTLTLANFRTLIDDGRIFTWFTNSVILAAGSTLGSLIIVTMAAYALARIHFRGRNVIFVSVLATQTLPFYLLLIPLFLLMVDLSLIDTHLGVILPLLAHPFGLFFMRQYMLGLPQELFDAARVDGATEYQVFWRVVLPMVKPALATLAVLFALESWNDLLWPLIIMRSDGNFPLAVGITSVLGLYRQRWDLVFTASMISVLPVVLLFLMLRKTFIDGLGRLGTGSK